jgi:hypothetical protein
MAAPQSDTLVDAELDALLPRGAEGALPRLEQAAGCSRVHADAVRRACVRTRTRHASGAQR